MPQAKKHSSTRARRNVASSAAVLPVGRRVRAPKLPEREDGWHAQTLAWWKDLWAAPMAAEYHSSDRHALFLLAVLMDEFWNNPSQQLAAEIRLQRQAFGLTPYDRRRLEWTIETTQQAKERGSARRAATNAPVQQPEAASDPRLALVQ